MARLFPTLAPRAGIRGGDAAEAAVLRRLQDELSDAYQLFHNLDWSSGSGDDARQGELDVVVVNQAGELLIVEIKAGRLTVEGGRLLKPYADGTRDVAGQQRMQYGTMRTRLSGIGLRDLRVQTMLVLPDVRIVDDTLQWPRERIVDASDYGQLAARVTSALGPGLPDAAVHRRVCDFLSGRFHVEPDVSALTGRLQAETARIASGLATWVPRMQVPSGLIRVTGTAGSGKTQLAVRVLRDAASAGRRAAYLCFNRALADHMATVLPVQVVAETFHERALRIARRDGMTPDFSQRETFDRLAAYCADAARTGVPDLDLIVLDEVQDLQPEWVEAMLLRLREGGRALLLEDPSQQLYADRQPFDLDGATVVTSHENYRTPRALVDLINLLGLTDHPVEALSPFRGTLADTIVCDRPERMAARTAEAVQRCIDRGFAPDEIAVISLKGRDRSALQGLDRLGDWSVRRFTGRYDAGGSAQWTEGDLLVESVRRFKGQAAPAVVVTECDFESLDAMRRRLLFVALTRARVHCEWVTTPAFEGLLGA